VELRQIVNSCPEGRWAAGYSETLKARDPGWGVRDLDRDLVPLAGPAGLVLTETVEMPANNLSVIFGKSG